MPIVVFATTLVVYLVTAGPTFYWLDSGEFVAAAWGLGVAHPPGHPLAALINRLFCYVPVGTIGFRLNLACAVQSAATVALIAAIARRGLSQLYGLRVATFAAAASAYVAAFSYALWFQAVRAEVYALNALLIAAIFYVLLRFAQQGDRRLVPIAALLVGLALCNHHLLVLLAAPAGLVFLLRGVEVNWRAIILRTIVAGLLGLATLAYLPLRAANSPRVDWGKPTSVERFGWVVSARIFQRTVSRVSARQTASERLSGGAFAVMGAIGPAASLLALAGLYLLWRRQQTRRLGIAVTVGVLGNLVSPLLVGFDAYNPDAYGYLAVTVVLLALPLAALLAVVLAQLQRVPKRAAIAACAVVLLPLPTSQLVSQFSRCNLRGHWVAEESARRLLDLPEDSLVLSHYFGTLFGLWALRETADLRPDIDLLQRSFVTHPGFIEDVEQRTPRLASLARSLASAQPALDALDRLAAGRPVFFEYDVSLSAALTERLAPAGPLARYHSARATAARPAREGDREIHRRRMARWQSAALDLADYESRRAVVWQHYRLAELSCRRSAYRELAHLHLRAALALAPADQALHRLARRCRLEPSG
ncbi:MAG: DUF2723 domain-containing protein [Deltaproteobacteria bacterium]|nr:DUF2723 domain-containing protein [Deltaproteobacteria bacterium]